MEAISDTAKIESYHAHVYYSDAATRAAAAVAARNAPAEVRGRDGKLA